MQTRSRRQERWDLVVLLALGVTEIMVAGKVVGPNACASRGVGVKIRSAVTDMALPSIRRCWACLLLRLSSSHSDRSIASTIEPLMKGTMTE